MLQEIIVSEPYKYKVSTREGGKIWEDITERLNANEAFAQARRELVETGMPFFRGNTKRK